MAELEKMTIYTHSVVEYQGCRYFLAQDDLQQTAGRKWLGVKGDISGFESPVDGGKCIYLFPLNPGNAAQLRRRLPWLNPAPLGLKTSAGFGDRLGLATPGHIQAVAGTGIAPVFAQQSVRENTRTCRTPQQVLDDAMWGAFQEGWSEPWGADADHIKRREDLQPFVDAGYTFFTVDPGDHVDNFAQGNTQSTLTEKFARLPWQTLKTSPEAIYQKYLDRVFLLDGLTLTYDELTLLRAAAKYGRALAHTLTIYENLTALMGGRPFDFEVSVDETESPTTVHEHFYICCELRRLGVSWVSLAPRFVGRFEKGVDYIGDLAVFEKELGSHASILKFFDSYKLSLHSGSDKFSIYPLVAQYSSGRVHVKTAGTSYLEALRVLALVAPQLFGEILDYSRQCYPVDCATYHVSAALDKVPPSASLAYSDLAALLDDFDARQVLHVTYGSVLERFKPQLLRLLVAHEAAYGQALKKHFTRHLAPFAPGSPAIR